MGPAATMDFAAKVVAATPAERDADHIPMLIASSPQIPDRSDAIVGAGPSPLPALRRCLDMLLAANADCIVLPCNTAHFWYDELAFISPAPILHIVDAALDVAGAGVLGLIATTGTLKARVYQSRAPDRHFVEPPVDVQERVVMPAIRKVKSGNLDEARDLLRQAAQVLQRSGSEQIVLGCTEAPLAWPHDAPPSIDATSALAHAVVRHFRSAPRPEEAEDRATRVEA